MNISRHIIADPRICHGMPVFKGTRIMVWQILELLEAGKTYQNIYKAHPSLPKGAVKAALHYAAQKVKGSSFIILKRRLHEKTKAVSHTALKIHLFSYYENRENLSSFYFIFPASR